MIVGIMYLEDIEANSPTADIDIGVEARGIEFDCWRDERVVGRERNGDLEAQSGVDLGQTGRRVRG